MLIIEPTMTFGEIVERFDVLYDNNHPFTDKLRFLYHFEQAMFPCSFAQIQSVTNNINDTLDAFEFSYPEFIFPMDDIYIVALCVYHYIKINDLFHAGTNLELLHRKLSAYKRGRE